MSKYTTQLRYICESLIGLVKSVDYPTTRDVIEQARTLIFDFPYPTYTENHKISLETKIIRHYYTREIAFETVGLWKFKLETKMNEIMPFYVEMLKKAENLNLLGNTDYYRDYKRNIDNNGEDNGTSKGSANTNSLSKYLDTPQGTIDNLLSGKYLTDASTVDNNTANNTTTKNTRKNKTNEGYSEHVTGKQGGDNYAKNMLEYKDTVLNIDNMIINDLEPLFFQLW